MLPLLVVGVVEQMMMQQWLVEEELDVVTSITGRA